MLRLIIILSVFVFTSACDKKSEAPAKTDATAQSSTHATSTQKKSASPTGKSVVKDASSCSCGAGKKGGTVWCEACGTGYIKGEKSSDRKAVEAAGKGGVHAHTASCSCGVGKKGGTVWCDACGSGYIKGEKSADKAAVDAALKASK